MNVRELKQALADLGPEWDEALILILPATCLNPGEATRLITIPEIDHLDGRYSWEKERAVWLTDGGHHVAPLAEDMGWKVPYCKPATPLGAQPFKGE